MTTKVRRQSTTTTILFTSRWIVPEPGGLAHERIGFAGSGCDDRLHGRNNTWYVDGVKLRELVETSSDVRNTRSRKKKVARLARCLTQLGPDEIEAGASYLCGAMPQGRIGVGYSAVRDARRTESARESTLVVAEVDRAFQGIAGESGGGSSSRRAETLGALMHRATDAEQEFLARLIAGSMRQGASEGLLVEAIAVASGAARSTVRRALMFSGDLAATAKAALTEGESALSQFSLQLFRPILPMLAQPTDGIESAIETLGEASFEVKLDGARIQVHKSGDDVRVFSRRLNDVTAAVPEVVEAIRSIGARELVVDGEVLALKEGGAPLPFQTTMRRFGRRLQVDTLRREIPLSPFYFDCLYVDGESLIDRSSIARIEALESMLPVSQRVERVVTSDSEVVEALWRDAIERGHEGLMAKSLDASYQAGGRGKSWLKLKPAHTLDLVVLAAEWGSGRRQGWLSNLHLGARDPDAGGFVMLGKTFKGMTDAMLTWQTGAFQNIELSRDQHTVYVKPEIVVEIAFSDVQQSPHYPGGMALRFARVKRYRPDKSGEQASTIAQVRAIFDAARSVS